MSFKTTRYQFTPYGLIITQYNPNGDIIIVESPNFVDIEKREREEKRMLYLSQSEAKKEIYYERFKGSIEKRNNKRYKK
jgi:hypothetical protein